MGQISRQKLIMREWILVRQMVPLADVDGGYVSVLQRRLHGEGEVREESLGSRLAGECKRPGVP